MLFLFRVAVASSSEAVDWPCGFALIFSCCAWLVDFANQVEKQVEHDVRIRRNYKNVLGQRNVACWQWVGSAGTSFDSIGVGFGEQMLSQKGILSWIQGFSERLLLLELAYKYP